MLPDQKMVLVVRNRSRQIQRLVDVATHERANGRMVYQIVQNVSGKGPLDQVRSAPDSTAAVTDVTALASPETIPVAARLPT